MDSSLYDITLPRFKGWDEPAIAVEDHPEIGATTFWWLRILTNSAANRPDR
jgi:hypothetical protein